MKKLILIWAAIAATLNGQTGPVARKSGSTAAGNAAVWNASGLLVDGGTPGGGSSSMFSTTGVGSWWPFGFPQSYGSNLDSLSDISGGVANRVQFFEFVVPAGMTIRKIVLRQGTVDDPGKLFIAGIYDAAGTKLRETALGFSQSNSPFGLTLTSALVLTPGTYFLAVASDSITIKFTVPGTASNFGDYTAWLGSNDTPRHFYDNVNSANLAAAAGSRLPASIGGRTANNYNTPPIVVLIP